MIVGVLAEILEGERRVALTPDSVRRIVGTGLEVLIEFDSGLHAGFPDKDHAAEGAAMGTPSC